MIGNKIHVSCSPHIDWAPAGRRRSRHALPFLTYPPCRRSTGPDCSWWFLMHLIISLIFSLNLYDVRGKTSRLITVSFWGRDWKVWNPEQNAVGSYHFLKEGTTQEGNHICRRILFRVFAWSHPFKVYRYLSETPSSWLVKVLIFTLYCLNVQLFNCYPKN